MKKFYKLLFICLLILSGGMALKAQTYNDSDSEYANRAEVPTYISKIAVAYGAKESTPKDILKDNGFTVIDYDLNKGCGSTTHYIYMGYKTTQNPSEAITGIFFRTGENPPASATFDGVTAYLLGGNGESNPGENTYVDLNADAGGSYIYTYVTRDASRAAVLQGLYFNSSNSASGCVTPNVNLNSGTGGSAIYLHYQQFSGKASATFHYLNSSGSRTSSTTSVSVKHHQQAVNNTPSAPTSVTYDGRTWTLLGWREDNTATTAGSTPSYTYMDSKVYRAVYSANVSLTYNANGGSGVPSTQNATQYINAGSSSIAKSNVSITIPATIPTHDATKCNFAGWNTSSSATTAQYQPGNNISINTNTILYAVWPEHNGTKTYFNIGENHVYTWSCCGKSMTEDHIYDDGIDCDLCDGYPATLVDGYYQINNANELLWFAAYVNYIDKTASAKLMNDIEMNAVQWTPIGTDAAYNGTFDGQGHTINNLWHNTGVADGGREGLFTLIGSNGVVKNIVLNNATIWGGSSYGFNSCGGIAIKNQGTISNCIIAGSTIQFGNYAHFGGIAGHNTGTIKNCAVRNSILRRRWGGVNNRNIGGITQTNNGTVTDCYSYDNIYEYGLTTCAISAEGNAPINSYQYTTSTVADAAETAKTKAQFASGEVAYLLQGEQTTQVWGQNIDNEETAQQYPVFSNAKVYKHTFNGVTLYSNHKTYGKCGDNLYWYVDGNNALTIYGTGAMWDYNNSDNKSPWRNLNPTPTSLVLEEGTTHIGNYAFYDCKGFTGSLTIPNSVTTIGNYAFYYCYGFTGSLTIGNSVTTIGKEAFYNCSGFTGDLTIPNSVTTIGTSAFRDCSGFTGDLTIPNSVTTIGNYAFRNCSGFTGDLTIPNSVTSIGDYAFYKCSGFNGSLTIGNSVTTIGDYAFYKCSGFTGSLTIGNSVTTIGKEAFYCCSGFTGDLTIPNSVTTIGMGAFYKCYGFTSLTIPNSVTAIGNEAFYLCYGFTGDLTIPNSVTTIGGAAFMYCSGFKGSLTIPNSVTTIGDYAFYKCSGFTGDLTIPNSVTTIGDLVFYECSGFTGSLTIPNSVTTIGKEAFYGCSGFTGSLTIPNSVTTIGKKAFYRCSGFTGDLTIPNSVTSIGDYAFAYCSGFNEVHSFAETAPTLGTEAFPMFKEINPNTTLYYPTSGEQSYNDKGWFNYFSKRIGFGKCGDNLYWYVDENNALTIYGTGAMYDYEWHENVGDISPWRNLNTAPTSLILEEGITHIGNYAFYKCSGFTGDLTIPNSVTTIGEHAFYNCSGFTGALTIGNSVTTIGNYAFYNCSGFTGALTIPNSVTTIGNSAFASCYSFTGDLTIGNSVTAIGNEAFYYCYGFTGDLTIPNSVTAIGENAFYYCSGFTGALTIPNSVTTIGNGAFYYCPGFTGDLTIPNSVTSIGESAFYNCYGFTGSLTIPNSVTTIGDYAFYNCSGFSDVYSLAETAPTLGTEAFPMFKEINPNTTLYYPTSGEQSYNDKGWFNYFSNRIGFGKCGDNLYWHVDENNALTIYGTGAMYDYDNSNNKAPWRNLETPPTSLVLEEGITHIGNNAFENCSGFTGSLTIPNSVTNIGNEAFYNCSGFDGSLTIGNSVTSIGNYAFGNCSGFKGSLTIPNSVTYIANYAFQYCSGFTGSLTIPNSVTSIEEGAFSGCSSFTGSLTIGNSVKTIGNYAFGNCSGFKGSLTIPNSVTTIGNGAFYYCPGFTGSLTIPNSVTNIGDYAFYYCKDFTGSLTIPNSVTSIGDYAFQNCSGFTEIFFYRDTNPTIGTSVFSDINANAEVCVPVIWESFDNIPEDKLVKMATFVGEQSADASTGSATINGWVGLAEDQTWPDEDDHVAINASLVLGSQQDNKTTRQQGLEANSLWVKSFGYCGNGTTVNGSITIEDGGQLYCEIANGEVTVKKEILGYQQSESESKWYTIASPLKDTIQIIPNSSFLTSNSDLYRYDEPSYTWQNAKNSANNGFNTIDPSRGYLYANAENTSLKFTGNINTETVTYNLTAKSDVLKGFHLIGNPFTHDIYLGESIKTKETQNIIFELNDICGDGWNGNALKLSFSDETPDKIITIESGNSETETINVASGVTVTVSFTIGNFPEECSFTIKNDDGEIICGEYSNEGSLDVENVENVEPLTTFTVKEGIDVLVNGYYTLTGEGAWAAEASTTEAIKPMQGILVKSLVDDYELPIFNISRQPSAISRQRSGKGQQLTAHSSMLITVSNAKHSDKAFIVFDKGVGLDKINHENENIPLLYIPMDDADYAIAMMDINVNEIPVSFETNVMGQYTISLRQDNCEFDELYLLDKQTGEKVNILENGYTFIATSNDAPERFVLLKDNGQQTTDNSHFAYINNGDIVVYGIEGKAQISIFDAMGRCLYKGSSSDETARIANDFSAGVYVIQKADDNGVKVQKLMID